MSRYIIVFPASKNPSLAQTNERRKFVELEIAHASWYTFVYRTVNGAVCTICNVWEIECDDAQLTMLILSTGAKISGEDARTFVYGN